MLLIWAHGLAPEVNPVKELYESLIAIDKKKVAGKERVTRLGNNVYLYLLIHALGIGSPT